MGVNFPDHAKENDPYRVMDSVQIDTITLEKLLGFILSDVIDHHIWNELAHGRFRSYNECIHTACAIWNCFKSADHTTYKSAMDEFVDRATCLWAPWRPRIRGE